MSAESNLSFQCTYNEAKEVLYVLCPDVTSSSLAEVNQAFQVVVKTIVTQGIPKVLLDSSISVIDVSPEQHQAVMRMFAMNLYPTRLTKFARVGSNNALREKTVNEVAEETDLPFQFRNFASVEAAMEWLTQEKQL